MFLEDLDNPELQGLTYQAPVDLDMRYYYYNSMVPLASVLSGPPHDRTDEERGIQKFNEWRLTELSSLEAALVPDDAELGTSEPQPGQSKGPKRTSSIPPQSDTAKAKAEAEAKMEIESKGKASSKGKSKVETTNGEKGEAPEKGAAPGKGAAPEKGASSTTVQQEQLKGDSEKGLR